jgi:hypothetical protein
VDSVDPDPDSDPDPQHWFGGQKKGYLEFENIFTFRSTTYYSAEKFVGKYIVKKIIVEDQQSSI